MKKYFRQILRFFIIILFTFLFVKLISSLISSNALAMIELSFFESFNVFEILKCNLALDASDRFCLVDDSVNTDRDLLSNRK